MARAVYLFPDQLQIPRHNMKGFTLLEVLLAAIVLTVGTVAIMMAFNSGIFATTDIENVEDAIIVAK